MFRVQGVGTGHSGSGYRIVLRASGSGYRNWAFGFQVRLGLRIWGYIGHTATHRTPKKKKKKSLGAIFGVSPPKCQKKVGKMCGGRDGRQQNVTKM